MGRPTDYSEAIVRKLEDAFRDGASITEACDQAGIVRDTYYRWLNEKDGFQTKMKEAQDWVTEIARAVVAKRITKKNDTETAKWWLERKKKDEFSTRTENTGKDGKDLIPVPILGGNALLSDNSDQQTLEAPKED